MAKFFKYAFRTLLVLAIIAAAVAFWKREQITRLLAVNSLFFQEKIVNNFSHMDSMFLTREMPLPAAKIMPFARGESYKLPTKVKDWIKLRNVTSFLVLKDAMIRSENYYLGTKEDDRRISWSVAKSFLSALFGILLDEGKIASLDDPVTKYAPDLAGSAYDGVSIRNVLQMASGVKFNEDYMDFNSDINRMGRILALGGSMDGFAAKQHERLRDPGQAWQYVSIDTHVIGMVIRGATGKNIADLMVDKMLGKMQLERPPYYVTDGNGVAFVLGGLNLTTRDYARFGLMIADGGKWNGMQIVPQDWVNESTRASAPGGVGYGYQWWIPPNGAEGEFLARGIYGQYIYINRPLGVVIVTTSADRNFRAPGVAGQNIAIFRLIAGQI